MKKRYRLSQKGKNILAIIIWVLFVAIIIGIIIQVYLQRIESINNGSFIVINDSECDK